MRRYGKDNSEFWDDWPGEFWHIYRNQEKWFKINVDLWGKWQAIEKSKMEIRLKNNLVLSTNLGVVYIWLNDIFEYVGCKKIRD